VTVAPPDLLSVSGLSKTFPGLRALSDVSLTVGAGEIVAVLGENGSGKSTLVKILAGVYEPDPGAVWRFQGGPVVPLGEGGAHGALHFIHQDLGLIPTLTTVENLDLGRAIGGRDLLPPKRRTERRRARELVRRYGGHFDVTVPVATLTPAQRTIVAITRAMSGWTRPDNVLVLDEPTAALPGAEVDLLFDAVRRVADGGAGVLFISHRLDEVMRLSNRVVVLRDGKIAAARPTSSLTEPELVRLVSGASEPHAAVRDEGAFGDALLAASGVSGGAVRWADLIVRSGEIVGVTGLLGSGREELGALLFGQLRRSGGAVAVQGQAVPASDPKAAIARGMGYVPADRAQLGAVLGLTLRENLTLPDLRPLRRRFGRLDRRAERRTASDWAARVDVRPPALDRALQAFSGGNQQKAVIAKWLRRGTRVLILDEPTQGVDVGAKATIHQLIAEEAGRGAAVLVLSSDTRELVSLCDRVLVMRDGVVATDIPKPELTEERCLQESLGLDHPRAGTAHD
jgi:ribose transport system ATP-binding protein